MAVTFQKLGGQAYFKGGTMGFTGSGKTFTMALLAAAIRRHFGLKGPVAMFDTESGSDYIGDVIKELTGEDLIGVKSRSLDDAVDFVKTAHREGIGVGIAESMTHVWRNLCESHLAGVNRERAKNGWAPRHSFEMQDWNQVKPLWNAHWADLYLSVPMHLIVAGRAGYEYDMEEDEESGKKKLVKTGVKMKTEGEFGFEPSLLWEMESDSEPDGEGGFRIVRHIIVRKDRFNVIDAMTFSIPPERDPRKAMERIYGYFKPHIERLTPGAHSPVDTALKTDTGADSSGDSEWARERRARTILAEEIIGALQLAGLDGQSGDAKRARTAYLTTLFGTPSWAAIETTPSARLREGLARIKADHADKIQAALGAVATTGAPVTAEAPKPAAEVVPPEEAERRIKASMCEGHEARLGLDLEARATKRQAHGIADLAAASFDQLVVYGETLSAIETPASGNGGKTRKKKGEPAAAGAAS